MARPGRRENRRKPEKPVTVTELLTWIADTICNDYCKYQDISLSEKESPEEAEQLLYEKYCANCPLNRL